MSKPGAKRRARSEAKPSGGRSQPGAKRRARSEAKPSGGRSQPGAKRRTRSEAKPSEAQSSTCAPSSTTWFGGRRKNAVALWAFCDMTAKSISRQRAMPEVPDGIRLSRPRK